MEKRSIGKLVGLTIITFGIYQIFWFAQTRGEMNARGATIPTTWLIIVPFVSIYWLWKYSEGVEQVTNKEVSSIVSFLLLWFIPIVDLVVVQGAFNKLGDAPAPAASNTYASPAPVTDPGFAPAAPFTPAPIAPEAPVAAAPAPAPQAFPAPAIVPEAPVPLTAPAPNPVAQPTAVEPTTPTPPQPPQAPLVQ